MAVFACVSAHVITAPQASLTAFQQLVMVLMKLRLNLTKQDLAYLSSSGQCIPDLQEVDKCNV